MQAQNRLDSNRMDYVSLIHALLEGRELDPDQCSFALQELSNSDWSDVKKSAFLSLLQSKGATGNELAGFASSMREKAAKVSLGASQLVDTCGTGGGHPSFNISTAAAIVAAAAGAKVAKHGNRSVTSKCGSADVLESLGVKLTSEPEKLLHIFERTGFAFFFAPNHHSATKGVAEVRKELGFRTIFNLLGPLANPAGANRQVIGVYDARFVQPVAHALQKLGAERAIVAHGAEGLDEISPCGETVCVLLDGEKCAPTILTPTDFGVDAVPKLALEPGESVEENAKILLESLTDPESLRAAAIVPSAAAAIWAFGLSSTFQEAASFAHSAIRTGKARETLETLIEVSSSI